MITQSELKELLHYNPETGVFTWSKNRRGAKTGDIAGSFDAHGYQQIVIMRKNYKSHRLAWFYVYGAWPENQIDHRNMKRDDNRIANLRLANNAENNRNRGVQSNNTSGYKGISFAKHCQRWVAYIEKNKKRKTLGYFHNIYDAVDARISAEIEMFGEFARIQSKIEKPNRFG